MLTAQISLPKLQLSPGFFNISSSPRTSSFRIEKTSNHCCSFGPHCLLFAPLILPITLWGVSPLKPPYLNHLGWILFPAGPWSLLLRALNSPRGYVYTVDTQTPVSFSQTLYHVRSWKIFTPGLYPIVPAINIFSQLALYVHLNLGVRVTLKHKSKHEKHFISLKLSECPKSFF